VIQIWPQSFILNHERISFDFYALDKINQKLGVSSMNRDCSTFFDFRLGNLTLPAFNEWIKDTSFISSDFSKCMFDKELELNSLFIPKFVLVMIVSVSILVFLGSLVWIHIYVKALERRDGFMANQVLYQALAQQ
jgi:hypothetical protein